VYPYSNVEAPCQRQTVRANRPEPTVHGPVMSCMCALLPVDSDERMVVLKGSDISNVEALFGPFTPRVTLVNGTHPPDFRSGELQRLYCLAQIRDCAYTRSTLDMPVT
jgi:hypothetical protein